MAKKKETEKQKNIREEALGQILNLMTASFGLVAALAWNQFVLEFINSIIKPILGKNSGLITSLIYALIVTILAVLVTFFITRFLKKG